MYTNGVMTCGYGCSHYIHGVADGLRGSPVAAPLGTKPDIASTTTNACACYTRGHYNATTGAVQDTGEFIGGPCDCEWIYDPGEEVFIR